MFVVAHRIGPNVRIVRERRSRNAPPCPCSGLPLIPARTGRRQIKIPWISCLVLLAISTDERVKADWPTSRNHAANVKSGSKVRAAVNGGGAHGHASG